MNTCPNLVGKIFSKLTVLERCESDKNGRSMWLCQCSCGVKTIKKGKLLLRGDTKSCGCWVVENFRLINRTHGESGTKEYASWCGAKSRCYRKKNRSYPDYGGRGITVCDRWKHSYANFISDMGKCPEGFSLDRIDVNGNYEPGNCRWANAQTQSENRRSARLLTLNGKTQSATKWAEELGIDSQIIFTRLHQGWGDKRTLSQPVRPSVTVVQS